jgi:hypothetical protein
MISRQGLITAEEGRRRISDKKSCRDYRLRSYRIGYTYSNSEATVFSYVSIFENL